MHILFVIVSVPLILTVCALLQRASNMRVADIRHRSALHWGLLGAPVVALIIGLSGLKDFIAQVCALSQQMWFALATGVIVVMGGIATLAIAVAFARLIFLHAYASRNSLPATSHFQAMVDDVSHSLGISRVRLFVRDASEPLAMTWGARQPVLLLSTWLFANLDGDELRAVIAHELSHVARRDFIHAWWSLLLHDAFFYLPSSRRAYRQLRADAELVCDEWAARITGDALSLASALAKIWHHAAASPALAQTLVQPEDNIEWRITRLMTLAEATPHEEAQTSLIPRLMRGALSALLLLNAIVMLSPQGCIPIWAVCS
jgi:Zn-dependent protease with chaperone function